MRARDVVRGLGLVLICLLWLAGPAAASDYTVSCIGDSITENKYPPMLKELLDDGTGLDWRVIDHGLGGYQIFHIRDAVAEGAWWNEHPHYVLILAGANDGVHDKDYTKSAAAMQDIVNYMRRSGGKIIVSAMLPSLDGRITDWAKKFNQRVKDTVSGIDYFMESNWDSFYEAEGNHARPDLMDDYLHPNQEGYHLIAENFYRVIHSVWADPFQAKDDPYQ